MDCIFSAFSFCRWPLVVSHSSEKRLLRDGVVRLRSSSFGGQSLQQERIKSKKKAVGPGGINILSAKE